MIEALVSEYDVDLSSLDSLSLTCADRTPAKHSLTGFGLAEGGMWVDQSAIEIRGTLSSSQSLPADRLCLATDHPGGYSGSMTLEQVPPDDSRRKAAFAALAKNNWAALNESLEVSGWNEFPEATRNALKSLGPADLDVHPVDHPKAASLVSVALPTDPTDFGFLRSELLFLADSSGRPVEILAKGRMWSWERKCALEEPGKGRPHWSCGRLQGVGDLDGDGQSDILYVAIGRGYAGDWGSYKLRLSSQKEPIVLALAAGLKEP